MTGSPGTENGSVTAPYRIVVGVDFSDLSEMALGEALEQGRARAPAELHLVTVIDHQGRVKNPHSEEAAHTVEEYTSLLKSAAAKALTKPGAPKPAPTVFVHVRLGSPASEITALASELGADLLVIATHGRHGLQRLWLGSIAERVVRLARCPLLMVRPKTEAEAVDAPEPEPPCPKCVAVRAETHGRTWWCEEHSQPARRPHVYVYTSLFDHTVDPYNKIW